MIETDHYLWTVSRDVTEHRMDAREALLSQQLPPHVVLPCEWFNPIPLGFEICLHIKGRVTDCDIHLHTRLSPDLLFPLLGPTLNNVDDREGP